MGGESVPTNKIGRSNSVALSSLTRFLTRAKWLHSNDNRSASAVLVHTNTNTQHIIHMSVQLSFTYNAFHSNIIVGVVFIVISFGKRQFSFFSILFVAIQWIRSLQERCKDN